MDLLKVSSRSNPNSVAGAMAGVIREAGSVEVQVIGAGALNQAIKAVAIARSYLSATELDLVCTPRFAEVEIEGNDRTAIRLLVDSRTAPPAPDGGNRSGRHEIPPPDGAFRPLAPRTGA